MKRFIVKFRYVRQVHYQVMDPNGYLAAIFNAIKKACRFLVL